MEQKDFLNIKHSIEKAEEDTHPVVAVVDDEVNVRGDVNNVKVEPKDYVAKFVVPNYMAENIDGAEDLGTGFSLIEIEYKNVFPNVKDNMKYTSAVVQLEPFYKKLNEDGSIEQLDDAEALKTIFKNLENETIEALFRLVQVVLHIDDELADWLTPGSVVKIGQQILDDFPSIVNQGDVFFG